MTIRKFLSVPIMTIFLLFFSAQLWAETDCSKEAIAYYLEKGFTPEQVTRMCQVSAHSDETATPANTATAPAATTVDGQVADASGNKRQGSLKNDDFVFFNRTILSDSLTVTPETLTYVGEECISYGEDDITGFQPKVCGVLKTTINRTGLVVLRAVKDLFIFRKAQLLVKGEIQREVINLDSLDSDDRKTFARILDPTPETLEIRTREDADPKEVAARLPR
jgi:hypothetical protein